MLIQINTTFAKLYTLCNAHRHMRWVVVCNFLSGVPLNKTPLFRELLLEENGFTLTDR